MKVAVIGSRDLIVCDLEKYLPAETSELVSGGARGVDTCARNYAEEKGLKLTEFLPDYATHGRRAPLVRNCEIIAYADLVLAFWDGESHGTAFVIRRCKEQGKPLKVFIAKRAPFRQLSFAELMQPRIQDIGESKESDHDFN